MKSLWIVSVAFLFSISCAQNYDFSLPPEVDNFAQSVAYNNKVDLLLIVDDSGSMQVKQENLRNAIPGMINALLGLRLDLRIGVVSTSMGGANPNGGRLLGVPKIMTSSMPN
ncbi:MAG: hypothetical protein N2578_03685, partial [Bdellovibrionaceae bacterium]|nr:hypothetical protein [Pseudobdellovibrionaceae bacterium]